MQITYKNKKLKKICTIADEAITKYGDKNAIKLQQRIQEIEAANSVDLLVKKHIGRCHLLTGDRKNQYAMDLSHPLRLIFEVKGIDINIVRIIEIVDYH